MTALNWRILFSRNFEYESKIPESEENMKPHNYKTLFIYLKGRMEHPANYTFVHYEKPQTTKIPNMLVL